MQQAPSDGWAFPDGDGWAALDDAASAPARQVEFFCESQADQALLPFRIGIDATGEPMSRGDPALAEWAARIARTLDRLAAGELIACDADGAQVPSAQWREPVTVVRETLRPWDKVPGSRIERYRIVRDRERLHVSLGPGPFAAAGRVVLSMWIELADGKRLPPLCLKKPPSSQMPLDRVAEHLGSIAEDRGIAAGALAGGDAPVEYGPVEREARRLDALRLVRTDGLEAVTTDRLLAVPSAIQNRRDRPPLPIRDEAKPEVARRLDDDGFPRPGAGERAGGDLLVEYGGVEREAVRLLEAHALQLVKTNGLMAAGRAIHGMMKMKKPVSSDTVRKYIAPRYWELATDMKIKLSPTSPKSKKARKKARKKVR